LIAGKWDLRGNFSRAFPIDCRAFHDPTTFHLRSHLGTHAGIQDSVIGASTLLKGVFHDCHRHLTAGGSEIFFGCTKGRHRSVALMHILRACLSAYKVEFKYAESEWFSAGQWQCKDGRCSQCHSLHPKRMQDAINMWKSLK